MTDHVPLVVLVLFTAGLAATVPALVRTWRGESTEVDLPSYGWVRRRKDQRRAGPAMLVATYLFCLSAWAMPLVDGDPDEAHPLSVALFFGLVAAGTAVFVSVATIVMFNRPKFLVPPHLRRQWGSVRSRRTQNRRLRNRHD